MDSVRSVPEMTREQVLVSAKKRLETFQLRRSNNSAPLSSPLSPSPSSGQGRSHSRNSSNSSMAFSTSTNSIISTSSESSTSLTDARPISTSGSRSRPSSHHRRRSSVSTRHESADLMGVDIISLPPSSSDDNVNFGDRDSIRRRALLALEGRNDFSSCTSMVEIPVISSTPSFPHMPADLPGKFNPITSSFGGTSSLTGKRDSFGKLLTPGNSLRDQLHTLLEEEEEEEDIDDRGKTAFKWSSAASSTPQKASDVSTVSPANGFEVGSSTPISSANLSSGSDAPELSITTPSPVPVRHRPTSLSLRPLTLGSNPSPQSLPTPSLTPSPRPLALRKLSLTPSESDTSSSYGLEEVEELCSSDSRDRLVRSPSPTLSYPSSLRRQSSLSSGGSLNGCPSGFKRQSSISYKKGVPPSNSSMIPIAFLPTPDGTPTFERRQSLSSSNDSDSDSTKERRTASEEIFWQQSHASLLARISELERALTHSRPRSRPASVQSTASSISEPPDEMLQLVADLKSERDDLKRDIEGWRQRVRDMEHNKGVVERRLEAERRENWLKGEKLGLVEVERDTVTRQLKVKDSIIVSLTQKVETSEARLRSALREQNELQEDANIAKRQLDEARAILQAKKAIEKELASAHEALAFEQARNAELVRQVEAFSVVKTPTPGNITFANIHAVGRDGVGFQSVDSTCTTVDPGDDHQVKVPFMLKAVEEESDMLEEEFSEDDGLAHYEDDDDSDMSFSGINRSSSMESFEADVPRSVTHLQFAADHATEVTRSVSPKSFSPSPSSSPCPTPTAAGSHGSRASLSKTWTFPRGQRSPSASPGCQPLEVDRFFGCLEDLDDSPPLSATSPSKFGDKSAFSKGLRLASDNEDLFPSFVLPAQSEVLPGSLEPVSEEVDDGEAFDCEEVEGGVKFTFPVSVSDVSLSCVIPPAFNELDEDVSVPFIFPQSRNGNKSGGDSRQSSLSSSSTSSVAPLAFIKSSNTYVTPKSKTPPMFHIGALPSRIPPPSPPKFSAPKSKTAPPKRKAVPTISPIQGSTSTGLRRGLFQPPSPKKGSRVPLLAYTSNANESNKPSLHSSARDKEKVDETDSSMTTTTNQSYHHKHIITSTNTTPKTSSQASFPSLSNFIPSGLWGSKSTLGHNVPCLAVKNYVPREKQLALLKERMRRSADSGRSAPGAGVCICSRCTGDLICI